MPLGKRKNKMISAAEFWLLLEKGEVNFGKAVKQGRITSY